MVLFLRTNHGYSQSYDASDMTYHPTHSGLRLSPHSHISNRILQVALSMADHLWLVATIAVSLIVKAAA